MKRPWGIAHSVWLAAAGTLLGCASGTPVVPSGPHPEPSTQSISVPFPPPPARVEVIPLRRRESCLWLDGSWDFRGGAWVWTKGSWLETAPACHYARPRTRFESTPAGTTLVYNRGQWYQNEAPSKVCTAPPVCTDVVGEE